MMEKTKKITLIVCVILLALVLFALVLPGFYSRWMADDYCLNAGALSSDFSSFLRVTMANWSGRYASVAFSWLFALLNPSHYGWLVLGVVLAWLAALVLLFRLAFKALGLKLSVLLSLLLGLTSLIVLFLVVPNLFQDLFWLTGMAAYTLPLVFFSLALNFAVIALGAKKFPPFMLLLAVLSGFLASGFAETALVAQLAFYFCCLIAIFIHRKSPNAKRALIIVLSLLVAGIVGFIIQYTAGGTGVRSDVLLDRLPIWDLAMFSLRNVFRLFGKLVVYQGFWVIFGFAISLLAGLVFINSESNDGNKISGLIKQWLFVALANFVVALAVCAAYAWFIPAYPDDRVVFVPYFFAAVSIVFLGLSTGAYLQKNSAFFSKRGALFQKVLLGFTVVILVLGAGFVMKDTIQALPALQDYSQRWDRRHVQIQERVASGERDIHVGGLEARYGLADLQLEADDWVNICMANYYGANSLTGK